MLERIGDSLRDDLGKRQDLIGRHLAARRKVFDHLDSARKEGRERCTGCMKVLSEIRKDVTAVSRQRPM